MRSPKSLAVVLAFTLLLASTAALATSNAETDVLIVFPEKLAPSKVYMVTDGEVARGLTVPFMAIANSINFKKRSEELGAELDGVLQGYDRYAVIYKALEARFEQRSSGFAVTESRDTNRYLTDGSITTAASEQGYDYVIAIEDKFSGLSMLNQLATRTDDLAPLTTLGFRLYDARKRSRMTKGVITSNGLEKRPYREAVRDRDLYVATFPALADSLANQLVGTLFRGDHLHMMAAASGHGGDVPEVGAVMKRFEKRFDYRLEPAVGWKRTRMNTKYVSVLEPRSDLRLSLGLRFEVDLLIPELGQDVKTLDEYIAIWQTRLADQGIDTSTFTEFEDIDAPEGFRVYAFDIAGHAGRQISMLRLLNDDMLQLVSLVFLKDFDTLYPQQRATIEQMIRTARLDVSK